LVHSQRERILDAVANLSAGVGYAAFTVDDIVGEAAVSLEAFYEHFKSKEDAFLVAYELGHVKGLGIVERAFGSESDWLAGVREAIGALLGYLASEPAFAHLALLDMLVATHLSAERFYAQMLLPGLETAPEDRRPPPITIEAIAGGLFELCFHYAVEGRIRELGELTTDATYFALAPFIGAKRAARIATEPAH
jgi:AcrR family transcriptional regulator